MTHVRDSGSTDKFNKINALLFFFGLSAAGLAAFSLINVYPTHKVPLFLSGFIISFTGMLGLRHFWPVNWGYAHILFVAVIARSFLIPLPPSDDMNRYIWEGKIQLLSLNPYVVSPADSFTKPFRDEIWQGINHKKLTSVYGPLSQLVFRATAFIHYSPLMLKIVLLVFDLGTLILLISFLKKRNSRLNEALLYAVNPLVLYSFAGEGHLESMLLFMLAGAILMYQRKHFAWMFILLGSACSVKLTAVMFIPLFVRKDTLKYLPFAVVPAITALPFGSGIISLFTITTKFGTNFNFNGFTYELLSSSFPKSVALQISIGLFFTAYMWNFFLTPDPVKGCGNVAVAFLLTSPTAHPWYFTIIAMFAVLYPARSWIALTGTVNISWLIIFKYWVTGIWKEYLYYIFLEYIPSIAFEIAARWRWPGFASPGYNAPKSLSIVIPVLNEGSRLRECLESIQLPANVQSEIIVVDGGSSDNTSDIAQSDRRVKLVKSDKGRGIQIAKGVNRSSGELIIVIHADTLLEQNCVKKLFEFSTKYPHICGGSIASKFDTPAPFFALITALNNFRSRFSGISFGDQVQFFRHESLSDLMPSVKLMEDIEISMLLKERGPIVVLPSLVKSSIRRWQKSSYSKNMLLVISLTALYIVKRRCGMLKSDNSDFYKAYYGEA